MSGRPGPNPSLVIGSVLVALLLAAASLGLVWTPWDPTLVNPPDRLQGPSPRHFFGTDALGRDVFSQILVGARSTLWVGVVAVGVAALIGVPLGIICAMLPGVPQSVLSRTTDLLLAFPALLLAIMLAAIYGGSTAVAMIAIGISTIPVFARVVRSGALLILHADFVAAARVAGRSTLWIAGRHIVPGVSGLIIVQASVSFAIAILAEAALSFLGFGTPPPTPSWGRMLSENQQLIYVAPRLEFIPAAAIALAVLGFNQLGDGLRDRLDPRLADRR